MYIEIHEWQDFEQKTLYFKLNNALNMNINDELNYKITGIYAIFKDDLCLYVGQSKNIASRLATHLKGKYKVATRVEVFDITDIGFSNYKDRSTQSQSKILDNAEQFLMAMLMPIENINIDMSFNLEKEHSPYYITSGELTYSYRIVIENENLFIVNIDGSYFIDVIKMDIEASQYDVKPYEITIEEVLENIDSMTAYMYLEKQDGN